MVFIANLAAKVRRLVVSATRAPWGKAERPLGTCWEATTALIRVTDGGCGITLALSVTQVGELDCCQIVYGAHRLQQLEGPVQNGRGGDHRELGVEPGGLGDGC